MNLIAWFESDFCVRLTQTLFHFVWQGFVVGLLVMVAG